MFVKPRIEPISMCCKAPLITRHDIEGTSFYQCSSCMEGADPIHISKMSFIQEWRESNKEPIKKPESWLSRIKKYFKN